MLLGRKVMTNLDSIFKSRDITLQTKVRLVKAMVFPVVMYGWVKRSNYRRKQSAWEPVTQTNSRGHALAKCTWAFSRKEHVSGCKTSLSKLNLLI